MAARSSWEDVSPPSWTQAFGKYKGINSAATGTRSNRTTCASQSQAMAQIYNFSTARAWCASMRAWWMI